MGFFDKLLSGISGKAGPSCPSCGSALVSDGTYGQRYECPTCADGIVYRIEDGNLNGYGSNRGGGGSSCEMCHSSLSGGTSYLPYEDGSNSHAYIRCPSCGHENIRYGFGED